MVRLQITASSSPGEYRATWLAMPRPMNPAPIIANRTGLPATARARNAAATMITRSPDLPRRFAPPPVLLQHLLVPQGVHRLPESAVAVRGELAVPGQLAERLPLPDGLVAVDIGDRARLENEEPAVDPRPVPGGLFVELLDSGPARGDGDRAEPAGRLDRGHRRPAAFAAMEGDQLGDVDVADAVAVGEAEGAVLEEPAHPPQPPAGHRALPGVHQGDPPGLDLGGTDVHLVPAEVEGDIRAAQPVIGEVFLDQHPLVAAADDEIRDAVRIEDLHHVPQDGVLADLHHRLRPHLGFLGQAGAQAPRPEDRFHRPPPPPKLDQLLSLSDTTETAIGHAMPIPGSSYLRPRADSG